MSEYQKRAMWKAGRIIEKVSEIYRSAALFKYSTDQVLERENLVLNDEKLSVYYRGYVAGSVNEIRKRFMDENIVTGYVWEGKLYATPNSWESFPEECRQAIREGRGPDCRMYYKTGEVYF